MKTSKFQFTKKLAAGVLSLVVLLGTTNLQAANSKDPVKKETKAGDEAVEGLKKTFEFNSIPTGEEVTNYKVYDANDNLVHEVRLNTKMKGQDKKLAKYLLAADFVMEYDNTRYYKIN